MSKRQTKFWVWFHRAGAIVWTLLIVPAYLFWQNSVAFVIAASIYANIKSDWSTAEAADDREVVELLQKILAILEDE